MVRSIAEMLQVIGFRPVGTSTMLMQPVTGQAKRQRLQPTHSWSITS